MFNLRKLMSKIFPYAGINRLNTQYMYDIDEVKSQTDNLYF